MEKYLAILESEIQRFDKRTLHLLKFQEKRRISEFLPDIPKHFIQDEIKAELEVFFDDANIVVCYDEAILKDVYGNLPDDMLTEIFKYLARHEYGHTTFCESTSALIKFEKKSKNNIFSNHENQETLENLFWFLFYVLREYHADLQAQRIILAIPKEYLDLKFNSRMIMEGDSYQRFYSSYVESSYCFHVFNQWDYFKEKTHTVIQSNPLDVILLINQIFRAFIDKNLDLERYKRGLAPLCEPLLAIDYETLIKKNWINPCINNRLKTFLNSI